MKKYSLLFFLALVLWAVPADASSLLYTFSSGDILAANALQARHMDSGALTL